MIHSCSWVVQTMLLQQLGIEVLMLLAGYAKVKKVVIFDFDKTLTTRDTFKIWIACVFIFPS